jgi:importin subunit alpha-1
MDRSTKVPEWRKAAYKNRGALQQDDLRRRREEASVEIRKTKREESLAKRRNLNVAAMSGGESDEETMANNLAHVQVTCLCPPRFAKCAHIPAY